MEFTDVERAVLAWFESNVEVERLREALQHVEPIQRLSDDGGVFVRISVPGSSLSENERRELNPLPGPHIEAKAIPGGAQCVLYVTESNLPVTLELFTFCDLWPEVIEDFNLVQPNSPMQSDDLSGHR